MSYRWVPGLLVLLAACSTTEPVGLADSNVAASSSTTSTQAVADNSAGTSANANAPDDSTTSTSAAGAANPVQSSGPELFPDPAADTPETWGAATSLAEFRNLMVDVHGPTDDLAGEFRRISPIFPTEVPTPPGAEIVKMQVRLQNSATFTGKVTATSSGTSEDLIALYRDAFTSAGYEESAKASKDDDGFHIEELSYDFPVLDPSSEFNRHTIDVSVVTGEELPNTLLEIKQVADVAEVLALDNMAAIWHRDADLIPTNATLQNVVVMTNSPLTFSDPRVDLTYSDFWKVEQALGQEIALTLRKDATAQGIVPDPDNKYGPDGVLESEFAAGTDFVLMKFLHPRFTDFGLSLNTDEGPSDLLIGTDATINLAAVAQ